MAGVNVNPLYRINKCFQAGISADVQYDQSANVRDHVAGVKPEVDGDDLAGFYQLAAVKANISRHIFLHVGYRLRNFHDPNNLMLGVGWRFKPGK